MGRRARGLARDLTMVPVRPWTPERCAEVETDCTCSLGALFLQDYLPKPKPKPKRKRQGGGDAGLAWQMLKCHQLALLERS